MQLKLHSIRQMMGFPGQYLQIHQRAFQIRVPQPSLNGANVAALEQTVDRIRMAKGVGAEPVDGQRQLRVYFFKLIVHLLPVQGKNGLPGAGLRRHRSAEARQ